MRPRLLDLFCCAGGSAVGYHQAGFDPYGVDIARQPNYPFPFHRGDALEVTGRLIAGEAIDFRHRDGTVEQVRLEGFDAAHGSPPCQGYTALAAVHGNPWPKLILQTRRVLAATGLPYVLENVRGTLLRRDMTLCGEMFGLAVLRHRYFEFGRWTGVAPAHKPHRGRVRGWRHGRYFDGPYLAVHGAGGGKGTVTEWQQAMGIDWTDDRREIAEAIPPAYTAHIGAQLLDACNNLQMAG